MGRKGNKNIKYSAVLAVTPYSDGVDIGKDSGKSPILICENAGVLAHIITKVNT